MMNTWKQNGHVLKESMMKKLGLLERLRIDLRRLHALSRAIVAGYHELLVGPCARERGRVTNSASIAENGSTPCTAPRFHFWWAFVQIISSKYK